MIANIDRAFAWREGRHTRALVPPAIAALPAPDLRYA